MRTQQRPQEGQQMQRKRKKGRDSEQQSGLLNISEQLHTYIREEDESCVEKVKSSLWPLLLSLVLAFMLGLVVYRYFWMIEHPKMAIQETPSLTPSLHKEIPYEQNQSPADHLNQPTTQQQKHTSQLQKPILQQTKQNQIVDNGFPTKLWYFDRSTLMNTKKEYQYLEDYSKNWQHYSKLSDIKVQAINMQNFKNHIKNQQIIQTILKINSIQIDNLAKQKIVQTIIMLAVLQNNGGVIIGGDMIITQPLDSFVKKTQQIPNSSFFFFNSSSNSQLYKINIKNYFIMARKSSPIISQLLQKTLLLVQTAIKLKQSQPQSSQKFIHNFFIELQNSFNLIVKSNQTFKESMYSLGNQDDIKIQNNPFLNLTQFNHFKYLYSLQQSALQQMIGPINSIVQFPSQLYNKFIIESFDQQKAQILKNSFIYQHLLSISQKNFLLKPLQFKNQVPSQQWKLPKIIWTVFNKNDMSDPLNQLFLQNIYQKSKNSGFQFVILTESNIKAIFSFQQLRQIQQMLRKISQNQNQNSMWSIKQDELLTSIIKLKVLQKYGGVFIDHGYFLLDNLQWLTKISQNQNIFNKKQHHQPDAFMFHKHGDFKWRININSGEKQADELIYSTKFIAANKESRLIKDWLDQVNKNLAMTKENLQNKFQSQCHIKEWKIQDIFEVTFQCMMSKGKINDPTQTKNLPQLNAYNIWSISNLFAGQKMEIISKHDESLCYSFDIPYIDFKQKFGSIGYISPIQTKGSKKQIDLYLKKQHHDSIFNQLFSQQSQKQHNRLKLWDHAIKDYIKDVINKVQNENNK